MPSPAVPPGLASVTVAMLLADARLPAGGHAHSAGLEPALAAGLAVDEVPRLLRGRVRSTTLVEAGTAVVARHVAGTDPGALVAVEDAWAARTPSAALRDAARVLGRGYLRLATRIWPDAPALELLARATPSPPRAVVLGAVAAWTAMTAEDLVRAVVYDDVAAAAAALLKLEPGDPAETTGWVVRVCTEVDPCVPTIAALTDPDAIPAFGAPHAEGWAEAHALSNRRLFRA